MRGLLPTLLLLACATTAYAQTPATPVTPARAAWVVVPASTAEPSELQRVSAAADKLVQELQRNGATVMTLGQTREHFRETASREPMPVAATDLDEFARLAREALDNYAFGRRVAAQRQVQAALTKARGALESLMRDTRAARHFLDACLLLVRSNIDRGDHGYARRLASDCRAETLNVIPTRSMHPPEVLALLAEVEQELQDRPGTTLDVSSEPNGCTVFLNGRALGTTPYRVRPPAGTYRVQVECVGSGRTGRVHDVSLGTAPAELSIDTSLEAAVRTLPGEPLRLELRDAAEIQTYAVRYAHQIGNALGAGQVLLVSVSGTRKLTLTRADATTGVSAVLEYGAIEGFSDDMPKAVEALLENHSWPASNPLPDDQARDGTSRVREPAAVAPDAAIAQPTPTEPAARASARSKNTRTWLAATGLIAGLGAEIAGWAVLLGIDPPQPGAIVLTAAGGMLALPSFAVLTFPSTKDGVPWWSWVAGGVGLGIAALGVYDLSLFKGECLQDDGTRCTSVRGDPVPAGGVLLGTALPLVLLPFTHMLFNHDDPDGPHVALHATPTGLLLSGTL